MDACEDLWPTAFSYLRSTGATVKVNKGGDLRLTMVKMHLHSECYISRLVDPLVVKHIGTVLVKDQRG